MTHSPQNASSSGILHVESTLATDRCDVLSSEHSRSASTKLAQHLAASKDLDEIRQQLCSPKYGFQLPRDAITPRAHETLTAFMTKVSVQDTSRILVLPGNRKESAAFHVGVVAYLIKHGYLFNVRHIVAQGFNAILAFYLRMHWDCLANPDDHIRTDEFVSSRWIAPMVECLRANDNTLLDTLGMQAWEWDDSNPLTGVIDRKTGLPAPPRLHLFHRTSYAASAVEYYASDTFHPPVTAKSALVRILSLPATDDLEQQQQQQQLLSPANIRRPGASSYASLWTAIESVVIGRVRESQCLVAWVSTAFPSDEDALFDEIRADVYHTQPNVLWTTLSYQTHSGNPAPWTTTPLHVRHFEDALELDASASAALASVPAVDPLVRWGRTVAARKLTCLRELSGSDLMCLPTDGNARDALRREAIRFRSTLLRRSYSGRVDSFGGFEFSHSPDAYATRDAEVLMTDAQLRENLRQTERWDTQLAERRERMERSVTSHALADGLWAFRQAVTADDETQMLARVRDDAHSEWDDTDMESLVGSMYDSQLVDSKTNSDPSPGHHPRREIPELRYPRGRHHHQNGPPLPRRKKKSSICGTFCSWIRATPRGSSHAARVPAHRTPPRAQQHPVRSSSAASSEISADLDPHARFDSAYLALDTERGYSLPSARQAQQRRRQTVLREIQTPRRRTRVIDFERTVHHTREAT